ncbi:gibberellin-regulated protein 1 [Ziziphus jujuba]|uniref:Gibberellin-regulated protein 1 n=2 Tax=Ziziphus jujuba TaxID=326968 RepID=A0A6P4BIP1_ZIZJJ|nr:gibberellin-regulated protein 1 [Ziziphus jujuba]KAH7523512.1 hypothetical protein FEM48_Zijuj06G0019300 [Ziziphus jujuba var. spinosa]
MSLLQYARFQLGLKPSKTLHFCTRSSLMAISKLVILSLLISLLAIYLVEASTPSKKYDGNIEKSSLDGKIDCGGACAARCQKSSRPRLCKRACGTCCQRCNCVPPGTAGNQEVCPCYAALTTHGGRRKCP